MAYATTQYTLTDSQIEAVKADAVAASDTARVALCDLALGGSPGERLQILSIINDQELVLFRQLIVAAQGGNGTSRSQAIAQLSFTS